ncbi:transcriptional regulator [Sporolactobacillus shoreae]|uniref:Transcriptional regulator n=1 Tax=Sporolactobacillus shoreae TaxID=1465501 RepID=A0A4Z0GLY8_9BACL|nr:transcriptional regulator [Sporolactobacillus shoreae]TGA97808.1 transcriptional regulator [Sporolactobacillus shoreae]
MTIIMTGTKGKIMDLLKEQERLSAHDLAGILQMTEMGVRKHLMSLIHDGLVQVEDIRKPVGRPVQIFSLGERADQVFPKNYETMTVQLLKDITDLYGDQAVDTLFDRRKNRLFMEYQAKLDSRSVPEARTRKLNELRIKNGYMSRLRQINDSTYELTEYNCPIFEVARQFGAACTNETKLFKDVLRAESVERIACQADGRAHCRFRITFKDKLGDAKSLTRAEF